MCEVERINVCWMQNVTTRHNRLKNHALMYQWYDNDHRTTFITMPQQVKATTRHRFFFYVSNAIKKIIRQISELSECEKHPAVMSIQQKLMCTT